MCYYSHSNDDQVASKQPVQIFQWISETGLRLLSYILVTFYSKLAVFLLKYLNTRKLCICLKERIHKIGQISFMCNYCANNKLNISLLQLSPWRKLLLVTDFPVKHQFHLSILIVLVCSIKYNPKIRLHVFVKLLYQNVMLT